MKDWLKRNSRVLRVIGILILVLVLPLILYTLYQIQNTAGRAASPDKLETEGGTLSSTGVSKQNDSGASGGSYVLFNNQVPSNTPASTTPPQAGGIIGYGASTTGGVGGEAIIVKNASEFKSALEKSGKRIITMNVPYPTVWVFGKADIEDADDNLTVICDPDLIIRGSHINIAGGDNIIIDGCSVGTGDEASVAAPDDWDTISLVGNKNPVNNVVLKNNTLIWGPDVTVAIIGSVTDVTLQDNIIAEGLKWSRHYEGTTDQPNGHSYGLNVSENATSGGPYNQERITITRNLLSRHMKGRTPQIVGGKNIEFTNNYVYGWGRYAGDGDPESLNYTNNYFEPSAASESKNVWGLRLTDGAHPNSVWVKGNIMVGGTNDAVQSPSNAVYRTSQAFTPTHSQMTATQARDYVLQNAGGVRNSWEERVINDVKNGVATFYNGVGHPAPNPWWP